MKTTLKVNLTNKEYKGTTWYLFSLRKSIKVTFLL